MLAYGARLQIFLKLTALHSHGDFFRSGFGKSRRDFVQIFFGFFYTLDFKADMIEALPQASIKFVMTAADHQSDFAIGE